MRTKFRFVADKMFIKLFLPSRQAITLVLIQPYLQVPLQRPIKVFYPITIFVHSIDIARLPQPQNKIIHPLQDTSHRDPVRHDEVAPVLHLHHARSGILQQRVLRPVEKLEHFQRREKLHLRHPSQRLQ